MKLSVLIPVFNEEKTVKEIINRSYQELKNLKIKKILKDFEIIIVNDGSNDLTGKIIRKEFSHVENISILQHQENKGKGAAIITALKEISGDYLLIQDADLEYDPSDYESLIKPVRFSEVEVVYGSRFKIGRTPKVKFLQLIGNKILTQISNFFTGFKLTDMETCYKLIKTSLVKEMSLKSKDFGIEPELTAKLSKIPDIFIEEIPVSYNPRGYEQGKKIRFKDGLLALIYIVKFNLQAKSIKMPETNVKVNRPF